MKNYYTQIGNIIKEGGAEFEIIGHKLSSLTIKKKSSIEKDLPEHELSFTELPELMASKKIIISRCENDITCDLPYENERDKVLLQNEITTIELSHKNKNLSGKNEELTLSKIRKAGKTAKVKSELKEKTEAFNDTIAGVEASMSKPKKIDYEWELRSRLDKYPNNAKAWSQADDGIRDLARSVRQSYNELVIDVLEEDSSAIKGLDFRSFKTPSEWNTKAKKQIMKIWPKLTPWAKANALGLQDDFDHSKINTIPKAEKGTKVKSKKKDKKQPKRGVTTLSERNYMKLHKKEFNALKDAYPDLTYSELIKKHKKAK